MMKRIDVLRNISNKEIRMQKLIKYLIVTFVYVLLIGKINLSVATITEIQHTTSVGTISNLPNTPAGKRVKESIRIINSGDKFQIQNYISKKFTKGFFKMFSEEQLLKLYLSFNEKYKGLEFHKVYKSTPYKFVGVFRCRNTGSAYLFGHSVLSKPPHKIQGLTILPMTHPDQPESLKSLSEKEKTGMLESYLYNLDESEAFSGAVLVAKNGKVVFNKAYGLSNRKDHILNKIETKFNLASINKMFTAIAVAQLCEKKKLFYNDPVGKYLGDDWLSSRISKKIQIRHLLSHTSGIGISKNDDNLKYLEKYTDTKFRRINDYKILTKNAFFKSKPGKEYSYSNMGFHLLGAVIKEVSGQEYYDYIQTHIFDVAGMKTTSFEELDQLDSNTAHGYVKEQNNKKIYWKSNESDCNWKGTPAGGAYSTVGDLLKFEQALKKNLLVSEETKNLLFTPKKELGAKSYGYGFSIRRLDDQKKVGHTGGYTGINNHYSMYLINGYTIIILCNIDLICGSPVSDIEFYISGLFF